VAVEVQAKRVIKAQAAQAQVVFDLLLVNR
jgi:hypothetical protein